jgi:hypothetical protein
MFIDQHKSLDSAAELPWHLQYLDGSQASPACAAGSRIKEGPHSTYMHMKREGEGERREREGRERERDRERASRGLEEAVSNTTRGCTAHVCLRQDDSDC